MRKVEPNGTRLSQKKRQRRELLNCELNYFNFTTYWNWDSQESTLPPPDLKVWRPKHHAQCNVNMYYLLNIHISLSRPHCDTKQYKIPHFVYVLLISHEISILERTSNDQVITNWHISNYVMVIWSIKCDSYGRPYMTSNLFLLSRDRDLIKKNSMSCMVFRISRLWRCVAKNFRGKI